MQQLTTAQHTAMLHAYYGCKVLHTNNAGYEKIVKPQGMVGEYIIEGMYLQVLNTAQHNVYTSHISYFKPILRRIDTLTFDEVKEWAKLAGASDEELDVLCEADLDRAKGEIKKVHKAIVKTAIHCINEFVFGGEATVNASRSTFDYLRSLHIDLGFLHIPSLIDADLAVDGATLK